MNPSLLFYVLFKLKCVTNCSNDFLINIYTKTLHEFSIKISKNAAHIKVKIRNNWNLIYKLIDMLNS
jgi:hypothetical protein